MMTLRAFVAAMFAASTVWAVPACGSATPATQPLSSSATTASAQSGSEELLISGELMNQLDSKTSKVGDRVVVRTRTTSRLADGVEIAKGAKLIGRVTGVKPAGAGSPDAQIAVELDRAELKDGQSLSIQGAIQSLAANDDSGQSDPMSPSPSSVPAGREPGDMYGSTPTIAPPSRLPNQAQADGDATSAVRSSATPGAIVARSGDLVVRTTAIPGLLLANHEPGLSTAHGSSILLAAKHDIHLEPGTRVEIEVFSPRSGSTAGAN